MEILNLAASALFNSFEKRNLDKSLLIEGTGLSLEEILNTKKMHSWSQFVKMYENCGTYIGYENVPRDIGLTGIYNDNISHLRKIGSSLIDLKTIYWYISKFVSKHLFKKCVTFNYRAVSKNQVHIEILIRPDLKDCRLMLETYKHLFENIPLALALPSARVEARISERKGEYDIYINQASLFKKISSFLNSFFHRNTTAVELLEQMEIQSIELTHVIEEKSQIIRSLSHDVANQIVTIHYYLNEILESETLGPEELGKLEIAICSTSKLGSILKNVQNIEAFSGREMKLVPVDIAKIFQYIKHDFEPQLRPKNIEIVTKNELLPHVSAMAQFACLEINVLGNLIANAIKFSPENSAIELRAWEEGDFVFISVKDQGVGISPEEKEHIFTTKIRNSSIGTHGEVGTGFGLGIVANYVKKFNGDIAIADNSPLGSIFTIKLKAHHLK